MFQNKFLSLLMRCPFVGVISIRVFHASFFLADTTQIWILIWAVRSEHTRSSLHMLLSLHGHLLNRGCLRTATPVVARTSRKYLCLPVLVHFLCHVDHVDEF